MTDCPNCEYHRKRALLWRDEAYRQAGHPLPEREWVGLTDEEVWECYSGQGSVFYRAIEAKLKGKNA
jgi:hypothetical protein